MVEPTPPGDSGGDRGPMVGVQVDGSTASRGKSLFHGTPDGFRQKVGGVTPGVRAVAE